MAKGSGANRTVAKTVYKEVKNSLSTLDNDLKTFKQHVESMNANTWYGGAQTMTWYNAADTLLGDLKHFSSAAKVFQEDLKDIFAKNKYFQ